MPHQEVFADDEGGAAHRDEVLRQMAADVERCGERGRGGGDGSENEETVSQQWMKTAKMKNEERDDDVDED